MKVVVDGASWCAASCSTGDFIASHHNVYISLLCHIGAEYFLKVAFAFLPPYELFMIENLLEGLLALKSWKLKWSKIQMRLQKRFCHNVYV